MLKYRRLSNCIGDFEKNILKNSEAIVLAQDYSPAGKKCFYLTDYSTFSKTYLSNDINGDKHYYEVIMNLIPYTNDYILKQ